MSILLSKKCCNITQKGQCLGIIEAIQFFVNRQRPFVIHFLFFCSVSSRSTTTICKFLKIPPVTCCRRFTSKTSAEGCFSYLLSMMSTARLNSALPSVNLCWADKIKPNRFRASKQINWSDFRFPLVSIIFNTFPATSSPLDISLGS